MAFRKAAQSYLALAFLASIIAACGSSNGGTFVGPSPTATANPSSSPTAPPIPKSSPFTAATAEPLPKVTAPPAGQTPQPVPVALPTTSAGFGGTFSLPVANASAIAAGTEAIVTLSNQTPSIAPSTFQLKRAQALSPQANALTPILFLQLAFSGGITLANQPPITFSLPAADVVSGASYYVALYDSTRPSLGWQLGFEGPGTVSGTNVSFTGGGGAFSFVAFAPYVFALYAQSATAPTPSPPPTPTPTPVPTATPTPGVTPTPVPTPAFGVTPTSISFTSIGATQTITAAGSAPYLAFTSDSSVVTIAPSSGNSPFTATAVAAGKAQITIVDSTGKQAIIPVTVTTATIPVQ